MDISENIKKYNIFLDPRGNPNGFTGGTLPLASAVWTDLFIPVFLTRTNKIIEYVDVQKDNTIQKIQRQNFNPYFIEFGFFDTIRRNKVNVGADLTANMINFIRSSRTDIYGFYAYTNAQVI